MPFQKGNNIWEMRAKHGRDKIFATPEMLWESCVEYFEWVKDNPLLAEKSWHKDGEVTVHHEPRMRAMSIGALCIFLGCGRRTWDDYRNRDDFSLVCADVEEVIRSQKFEGASADLLNASIIARDLGLADKSELTGKDGGPIETKNMTDTELARWIAFNLRKGIEDAG